MMVKYSLDRKRNVVSYDPLLNTDSEALYRFLLSQSRVPPTVRATFKGTHYVTSSRLVTSTNGLNSYSHWETQKRAILDFYFCIDIHPDRLWSLRGQPDTFQDHAAYTPVDWTVPDDQPAFRGRKVLEVESNSPSQIPSLEGSSSVRTASSDRVRRHHTWVQMREKNGYPPWMKEEEEHVPIYQSTKSSKSLKQWVDEYCASPKYLKRFVHKKTLFGWNFSHLESSLRSIVLSTGYSGHLEIDFNTYSSKITVSSSRLFRFPFVVYPFTWLFKRSHKVASGIWQVSGVAYPLNQRSPTGRDEAGSSELEWIRNWEGAINDAVIGKYCSRVPLEGEE